MLKKTAMFSCIISYTIELYSFDFWTRQEIIHRGLKKFKRTFHSRLMTWSKTFKKYTRPWLKRKKKKKADLRNKLMISLFVHHFSLLECASGLATYAQPNSSFFPCYQGERKDRLWYVLPTTHHRRPDLVTNTRRWSQKLWLENESSCRQHEVFKLLQLINVLVFRFSLYWGNIFPIN